MVNVEVKCRNALDSITRCIKEGKLTIMEHKEPSASLLKNVLVVKKKILLEMDCEM